MNPELADCCPSRQTGGAADSERNQGPADVPAGPHHRAYGQASSTIRNESEAGPWPREDAQRTMERDQRISVVRCSFSAAQLEFSTDTYTLLILPPQLTQ